MKPIFGSAYLDDNLPQFTTIHYSFHVINRGYDINRGHCLSRASKNISGLIKVSVTSPAGLRKFFLNVEPCMVTWISENTALVKQYCVSGTAGTQRLVICV